jgi:iron complex outermembrane receptor protein
VRWLAASLLLAGALPARAAPAARATGGDDLTELTLESLMQLKVVGASRYEQRVSEAPSYVSVVTREEIQRFGYRDLGAILRSMPGLFTSYDRSYTYLGIRGFAPPGDFGTRVLLVVDGHRMNNDVYDQALFGNEFPIDIDLVERVEFIRGPSSSVYGSNAFFGIINVVTRRGKKVDGVELSASAASYETFQGRATYGRAFKGGQEVLVSGTASGSQGQDLYFPEFNDPATNNGVAVNADGERRYAGFAKVVLGDFTLEGVTASRRKNDPTGRYGTTFNDSRNFVVDEASFVDVRYQHVFSGGLDLVARLFLDHTVYHGDYVYQPLVSRDYANGDWWGAELQAKKKVGERLLLTGGLEYRDNFRQEQGTYDVSPYDVTFHDKRRSSVWSAYLQGELRILPTLLVNAGLRYDHYDTFGGNWSPRVGVIWSPLKQTAAKLLYGSAFRVPNVYELYYADNVSLLPNPALRPETIDTYEAVVEQFLDLLGAHWKGTAAAYHYRTGGLIAAVPDPSNPAMTRFENSTAIEATGLELELDGRTPGGFGGRASYSIQQSRVAGGGLSVPNSPARTAKLNLFLPFLHNTFSLNPEVQYLTSRKTVPGKPREAVGGYAVCNLTLLVQEPVKKLDLSVTVYNLLGAIYSDPVGSEFLQSAIRQDGVNFRVKATYRF